MKKAVSIVFQVRFDDKNPGASRGLFPLYRQLRRKGLLARFCRDAFLEKAARQLNGQDNSYQQLDSLIKSKGVGYILESIQQKEVQVAQAASATVEATVNHEAVRENIALANPLAQPVAITAETAPEPEAANEPEALAEVSIKKVDLEKLKGLL